MKYMRSVMLLKTTKVVVKGQLITIHLLSCIQRREINLRRIVIEIEPKELFQIHFLLLRKAF